MPLSLRLADCTGAQNIIVLSNPTRRTKFTARNCKYVGKNVLLKYRFSDITSKIRTDAMFVIVDLQITFHTEFNYIYDLSPYKI